MKESFRQQTNVTNTLNSEFFGFVIEMWKFEIPSRCVRILKLFPKSLPIVSQNGFSFTLHMCYMYIMNHGGLVTVYFNMVWLTVNMTVTDVCPMPIQLVTNDVNIFFYQKSSEDFFYTYTCLSWTVYTQCPCKSFLNSSSILRRLRHYSSNAVCRIFQAKGEPSRVCRKKLMTLFIKGNVINLTSTCGLLRDS